MLVTEYAWKGSRSLARFPWFVFLRFFFVQIFGFNLLFLICLSFLIRHEAIAGSAFWVSFALFSAGSVLLALLTSYRFTRPIRRALSKALRISSKKYARMNVPDQGELFEEEPGEYSELETALDRIDKKLKKKKEQLLREREENAAFMGSVQEGVISVDTSGKLLYFNSQFAALFVNPELLKASEGLRLTDALRVPEIFEAYRKVLETGLLQKVQVRLSTRLDNQPRAFVISMTALRREKSGEIRGVIGLFHDITDLQRAQQIRIDFVANASHELRTPLTSIKGYMDTIKEDAAAGRFEQAIPFLDVVSRNVDRLIELVRDLLSLSALEHHAELKLETVNALAISDHVVKELASQAADKGQVIRVNGQVPPFIADARKVEQVLRNLLGNAIKYIPEGKQVQILWETNERGQILLRVKDNGPGIPEEHHARLFERFYRIDKGRSRDAGGTGLGLAIVKHIMQSHGGGVTVKSQVGVGSEFICLFPSLREGLAEQP